MTKWNCFLWSIFIGVLLTSSSQAEVRLGTKTLSVHVHEVAMLEVLQEFKRQGNMQVVALEDTKINNVRISKIFWDLPLDEGLDRILSGWNYGISRDASTGKITTLYLVSRRTEPSELPEPPLDLTNQPSGLNTRVAHTKPTIPKETYDSNLPDFEYDESDDTENEEKYQEFIGESDFPVEEN